MLAAAPHVAGRRRCAWPHAALLIDTGIVCVTLFEPEVFSEESRKGQGTP
jgi:hypothetical protein